MGLRKRFLVVVVGVPGSPAEAQRSEVGRFRSTGAAEEAGREEWRRILFVHAPHVDRYRIVIEDDGVEVGEVPMPELPADAAPGILDETVTPLGASIGALGEPIDPEQEAEAEPAAEPEAEAVPEPEPAVESEPTPEAEPEPEPEPEPTPEAIDATGELEVIEDDEDLAATGEHAGLADQVAAEEVAADDVAVTGEVPVVTDDQADDDAPPAAAARPYIEIEDPPEGPVPEDVIARFADMVKAEEERAAERAARERGDAG